MDINEQLALERTKLANWRTFLAYIRTGVSFIALGAALFHFLKSPAWAFLGIASTILGIAFLVIGGVSYKKYNKKLEMIKKRSEKPGKSGKLSD